VFRVATLNSGRKISNFSDKVTTKDVGALLVTTGLLSRRISFFVKLDKKLWAKFDKDAGQNAIPNMGPSAKFYRFQHISWANIKICIYLIGSLRIPQPPDL
jgi:hypothetical protein